MRSLRRLATCCRELARVGEGLPRNCVAHALPRGSVLSRVLAPVLRAQLEPDVVSTVPPPLSCSTSLLQALEVRPRLKQVRPPFVFRRYAACAVMRERRPMSFLADFVVERRLSTILASAI